MGLPNSLGLFSLSQTAFSTTTQWIFYLLPPAPDLLSPSLNSVGDVVTFAKGALSTLTLAQLCQKVSLPFQGFETANHPATNIKYIAEGSTLESVTVEYLETREHFIQRYFLAQQKRMYDPIKKIHNTGNHKLDGYLLVFPVGSVAQDLVAAAQGAVGNVGGQAAAQGAQVADNILNMIPSGIYHYDGLLYKGMQALDNDYVSDDLRKIQVTFEVDRITREDENIPGLNDLVNMIPST